MNADKSEHKRGKVIPQGKLWIGFALASLAIGCVFFFLKLKSKEPEYSGQSLSEWCKELDSGNVNWFSRDPILNQEAVEALRNIGERATPYLVAQLKDSLRKEKFYGKLSDPLEFLQIDAREKSSTASRKGSDAILALNALGKKAVDAIPAVTNLLNDESTSLIAAYVLAPIGKPSVQHLSNAISSDKVKVRFAAISAARFLGESGESLIPSLLGILNDKKEERTMRTSAARALGMIGGQPEIVVPSLERGLQDNDFIVRRGAAFGLVLMKSDAQRSIPAVESALKTPSGKLDQWILIALVGLTGNDLAIANALEKSFSFQSSNAPISDKVVNSAWSHLFDELRCVTNISSTRLSAARNSLVQMAPMEGIE